MKPIGTILQLDSPIFKENGTGMRKNWEDWNPGRISHTANTEVSKKEFNFVTNRIGAAEAKGYLSSSPCAQWLRVEKQEVGADCGLRRWKRRGTSAAQAFIHNLLRVIYQNS